VSIKQNTHKKTPLKHQLWGMIGEYLPLAQKTAEHRSYNLDDLDEQLSVDNESGEKLQTFPHVFTHKAFSIGFNGFCVFFFLQIYVESNKTTSVKNGMFFWKSSVFNCSGVGFFFNGRYFLHLYFCRKTDVPKKKVPCVILAHHFNKKNQESRGLKKKTLWVNKKKTWTHIKIAQVIE